MKINACVRGGAAPGFNAYAPIDFELEQKPDARFGVLGGVSVGNLKSAMWACGLYGERAKQVVKSIKFDRIMRNTAALQDKTRDWISKIIIAPIAYIGSRYRLAPEFRNVLGMHLSWDLEKHSDMADEVYLGFADRNEFGCIAGSDKVSSFLDLAKLLKGNPDKWNAWREKIHPYWAGRDGVYSWTEKKGFHKISDTVIPMHLAVYGGFANPVLQDLRLTIKIGKRKREIWFFDGGVINNHSNLIFAGTRKPWMQIACEAEPLTVDNFSDSNYWKNPSKNYVHLKPTSKNIDFFGFTDRQINEAYDRKRQATNLWK